jgi:hypothetical protein
MKNATERLEELAVDLVCSVREYQLRPVPENLQAVRQDFDTLGKQLLEVEKYEIR